MARFDLTDSSGLPSSLFCRRTRAGWRVSTTGVS